MGIGVEQVRITALNLGWDPEFVTLEEFLEFYQGTYRIATGYLLAKSPNFEIRNIISKKKRVTRIKAVDISRYNLRKTRSYKRKKDRLMKKHQNEIFVKNRTRMDSLPTNRKFELPAEVWKQQEQKNVVRTIRQKNKLGVREILQSQYDEYDLIELDTAKNIGRIRMAPENLEQI